MLKYPVQEVYITKEAPLRSIRVFQERDRSGTKTDDRDGVMDVMIVMDVMNMGRDFESNSFFYGS